MKYIKSFEYRDKNGIYHKSPQIGDYVITNILIPETNIIEDNITEYTNTHTGKITCDIGNAYTVHYDNVPDDLKTYFIYDRIFSADEIIWSKNKEELLQMIINKKYNL